MVFLRSSTPPNVTRPQIVPLPEEDKNIVIAIDLRHAELLTSTVFSPLMSIPIHGEETTRIGASSGISLIDIFFTRRPQG